MPFSFISTRLERGLDNTVGEGCREDGHGDRCEVLIIWLRLTSRDPPKMIVIKAVPFAPWDPQGVPASARFVGMNTAWATSVLPGSRAGLGSTAQFLAFA